MTDITIWLTYHDDSMIGQYDLKEDEVLRRISYYFMYRSRS